MWLDRFSGHSTPSGSPPPPQSRSYSPAPRRSSHLAPGAIQNRPGLTPRSSSLTPLPNNTTPSHQSFRASNGSALKYSVANTPPSNIADPLQVLENIIGAPPKLQRQTQGNGVYLAGSSRPAEIQEDVDFQALSLQDFVRSAADTRTSRIGVESYSKQSVNEYDKEKDKFEDLHRSILACDDVLNSVETYLTSFQKDLGVVSAEIETLQSRSTALNTKLENRKTVEKLLGPAIEEISISPAVVRKISEGPIDEQWIKALEEVDKRSKAIEAKSRSQNKVRAVKDVEPLLENLTNKALERIRDFLVAQIKALRSPNINAQIIQQQTFIQYKELYAFLARHHPKLAEEIGQAYINTMRWYYTDHFQRYQKALEKMTLHSMDKHDVLAQTESGRKVIGAAPRDATNLGRRIDLLKTSNQTALTSYVAGEDRSTHYLEVPFRNYNLALVDNASAEYSFLMEFFFPNSLHQVSRKFIEIFEPVFAIGRSYTRQLVDATADALGVLLCVRLNQHFAFELQRRKVPTVDSYINGINMLLWPRFQIIMDMHCQSIQRMTATSSSRSTASALSLTTADSSKQSAAPHSLAQRFGQLLQGILALSSEAGDDEPVSNSLSRLRNDFEAFLTKLSKGFGDARKRDRFLYNNYSLVLTIISDTASKLAEEQKQHYERLKDAFVDGR
ncbi:MAG: hypothetical protein M1827_001804 [Pycnora praestabilis]|nr:MAG: hypothetical protein M1827_001804 [Pycnora praestabilis]